MDKTHKGRVLIVAGSDSGGGAGIQGDIKTVSALGGYAMTAVTALTAQNTRGVFGVFGVPAEFVAQQIDLCLGDIGADAAKTGMLLNAEIILAVAEHLPTGVPLVLDPVMVAKGGASLLDPEAIAVLKDRLVPRAALLTPNLPEAGLLLGRAIDEGALEDEARALLDLGPKAVLLKGGHGSGDIVTDVLATEGHAPLVLRAKRLKTRHTHGTGCALASAVATGIAQGMALADAVARAHAYVQHALAAAPGFGNGNGPLGHWAAN
ncbi:MAG: bifunctional hydroxymethylpyrimidine kinase/phosphomethylpyrimidine kinase [Alphaproteobacteria bacterium]